MNDSLKYTDYSLDDSLNPSEREDNNSILPLPIQNIKKISFNFSKDFSDTKNISKKGKSKDYEDDYKIYFQNKKFISNDFIEKEIRPFNNSINPIIPNTPINTIIQKQNAINIFNVKKRGKKRTGKYKKIHKSTDFDNLQTKIQVHFISFIINISNDALSAFFGKKKISSNFKDIPYNKKRYVSFNNSYKFKNSPIKDILLNEISAKYKKYDINININTLNKVCALSQWLEDFFNMKYINLFIFYYNKEQPLKEIIFKDKKIILSRRTKTFYDLLVKNKKDKLDLIETARSVYFYGYDTLIGKDSFIVEKNEDALNDEKVIILI